MWHLESSPLTREWTWAPCFGSVEAESLNHQVSPLKPSPRYIPMINPNMIPITFLSHSIIICHYLKYSFFIFSFYIMYIRKWGNYINLNLINVKYDQKINYLFCMPFFTLLLPLRIPIEISSFWGPSTPENAILYIMILQWRWQIDWRDLTW